MDEKKLKRIMELANVSHEDLLELDAPYRAMIDIFDKIMNELPQDPIATLQILSKLVASTLVTKGISFREFEDLLRNDCANMQNIMQDQLNS